VKKILWRAVFVLLVLVIAAVIAVGLFLGDIVKKGVETLGPKVAKVSVTVQTVNLSLLTGSATVKGLVVGNPEGYQTPDAINIGKASVGVEPFSVLSDKIHVRSIQVDSPQITFEGGLHDNNLSKILDNINATGSAQASSTANPNQTAAAKPAKKFEVDDLVISGAKVHVSLTTLGGKEMTLPLPEIHLTDLGKGDAGITAADLSRRVLNAILSATTQAIVSNAAGVSKEATKAIGEGVNKAAGGLKNLFGK
jgi:hypothetical protein